jgi:hypothetical protein
MKGVARCPANLIADRMRARARSGATGFARPFGTCSGCPATTAGGIGSRHVKGQRADDPQAEPANSPPPGLATTVRMAARPSSCLQRRPAAPFDLSAAFSIRVRAAHSIHFAASSQRLPAHARHQFPLSAATHHQSERVVNAPQRCCHHLECSAPQFGRREHQGSSV